MAVPPAWTDVWICPDSDGHLQATGRDAKGRKQFVYHPDWRAHSEADKFGRLAAFGEALPAIRRRVESDLRLPGMPKEKVLALIVRLLEATRIRIGNEEYASQNQSFGLTTLRANQATVGACRIRFAFSGKSGKWHQVTVSDRRLARLVRACQDLPGQALFQYCDDAGEPHTVHSHDVNEYLRDVAGGDFTAKDFRTWAATVEFFRRVLASDRLTKREVSQIVREVAQLLGNTPTVCRKSYIHPDVLALSRPPALGRARRKGLDPVEAALVAFLARLPGDSDLESALERSAATLGRPAAAPSPLR